LRSFEDIKLESSNRVKVRYNGSYMLDLDDFLMGSRVNDPGATDLDPNQGMFYVLADGSGIAEVKVAVRNSDVNGNGQVYYDTLLRGSI
jgi:hypothetical protein